MANAAGPNTELADALSRFRFAFIAVAALSAVLNILLIAGSLYLMLVYDSVLPSQSIPTLVGLFVNLLLLFFDLRPAKTVIILFTLVIAGLILLLFVRIISIASGMPWPRIAFEP